MSGGIEIGGQPGLWTPNTGARPNMLSMPQTMGMQSPFSNRPSPLSGGGYGNSGLHRFGGFQPYRSAPYVPLTFQAPQLGPRQSFQSPQMPSYGGLLDPISGGEGPSAGPATTPGAMPGFVAHTLDAFLGFPVATTINSFAGPGPGVGTSSVGVGAAPGTPGGIGAIGGDGSEGGTGIGSSVGVGSAVGTPGGIGAVGGIGDEGSGDGQGGGGDDGNGDGGGGGGGGGK
jgi:hypothetical protein